MAMCLPNRFGFSNGIGSPCCVEVAKSACEAWCMLCFTSLKGNILAKY